MEVRDHGRDLEIGAFGFVDKHCEECALKGFENSGNHFFVDVGLIWLFYTFESQFKETKCELSSFLKWMLNC